MNNKELYCFVCDICDSLSNENAPITSRGIFRGSWRRADGVMETITIITLHAIERNPFTGCYV